MINVQDMTIVEIQDAMDQKQLTARELVLIYLSRIAQIDQCEEGLNAVLEINPDALFVADMLDEERKKGRVRSLLHGIPIMLKDTINTADSMHTSAGSLALADNLAPYDAHVATRLRQAGAIILAKTNMTEFANFMGENMPAGYSSRGGQVISPYNRDCSPSGSSTGSAVAVAARLCSAALGTENFGSINYPAQQNGIVGIKPTMGLVSRYGNVPTTYTLDTIGPMASSVMDAAIVLGVIAGRDEHDPATWTQGEGEPTDYAQFLDRDGLEAARIGIDRAKWDALTGARQDAFNKLLSALEDAGATIVGVGDLAKIISESEIDPVFFYECKSCMNAYLATLRSDLTCTSVQEIIGFNQRHASQALKYGQPMLLHIQNKTSGSLTEPEYLEALAKREGAIRALDEMFATYRVDALLCTQPEIIAPITGFPSMSIPIGSHENRIPIGAYWVARRYDEATLLRITFATESLSIVPHMGVGDLPERLRNERIGIGNASPSHLSPETRSG
jgi:amidase